MISSEVVISIFILERMRRLDGKGKSQKQFLIWSVICTRPSIIYSSFSTSCVSGRLGIAIFLTGVVYLQVA